MKDILSSSLAKYYLPSGNTTITAHSFDGGVNSTAYLHATRHTNTLVSQFFEPIDVLASKPVIDVTPTTGFEASSLLINFSHGYRSAWTIF